MTWKGDWANTEPNRKETSEITKIIFPSTLQTLITCLIGAYATGRFEYYCHAARGFMEAKYSEFREKKYFRWRCEKVFKSQKLLRQFHAGTEKGTEAPYGVSHGTALAAETRASPPRGRDSEPWQCGTRARGKASAGTHHAATFQLHSKSLK